VANAIPLAQRLRSETATAHHASESLLGVPAGILDRADYAELLQTMLAFHLGTEGVLYDERWASEWAKLDIAIARHDRSAALIRDLSVLDSEPDDRRVPALEIHDFAEALGCLYVVEGSALGGRVIAPLMTERLGQVPTEYYAGTGREHPKPWRAVQAALAAYAARSDADSDAVITGALTTFAYLGQIVDARSAHRAVPRVGAA
jgi:heme oxygenase